jgi:hypothetical protein
MIEANRLWSLLEMLRFYADKFTFLMHNVAFAETIFKHLPASPERAEIKGNDRESLKRLMLKIEATLNSIGMGLSAKKARALIKDADDSDVSREELGRGIDELRSRITDEMENAYFLHLTEAESLAFEANYPFGNAVFTAFPSANDDIAEASKCLGLGRSTACVMHLMRAAEAALKTLATTVGVAPQTDWGTYLREIEKELTAKARAAGKATPDEQFYSEAAASFDNVKRAWRNSTMHVDRSYSPERAEEIFAAVKSFMVHLSTKIHE